MGSLFESAYAAGDDRRVITVARILVAATLANLRERRRGWAPAVETSDIPHGATRSGLPAPAGDRKARDQETGLLTKALPR